MIPVASINTTLGFLDESFGKRASNLEALLQISDSDLHLERTFLSPASLRALAATRRWMQDAGMKTWLDSVGNLHGLLSGGADQPTLLLGSHIDTVIDGGAYDGTLGIVTAISAVKNLKLAMERESKSIRRNVEVCSQHLSL